MAGDALRVGLIGAGRNSREKHIPGFQAIEGVRVVAVCNRSRESGWQVASEFGIERVETDPEALFAASDIDAICIGTWPYRHREYAVRALEAGKHVLCEARMAMDAVEACDMLAAAEARPDRVAQLVPVPLDLRSWRTVRRLVSEAAFGHLREVHVTSLNGNATDVSTPLHWRERREYSGVNAMNLGMLNEVVQRWLGPTERVVADAATYIARRDDPESGESTPIDVPDSLGVLARMANGARVTYRLGTTLHAANAANGISVYGSAATLHWSMDDTMTFARAGEPLQALAPDAGTAGSWRVEADFVDSIRTGAPVELTSFADGLDYMRFTEAVARSAAEGRVIDLASV